MRPSTLEIPVPEMRTEIRIITPDEARLWMDHRAPNRKIDSAKVMAMARDMLSGHWRVTHQGIAFGPDGLLVDGQHRLAGIILADRPAEAMVTWNLPPEANLVIDDHRPRSGADVLSIEQGVGVDTLTVAILRFIERPASAGTSMARFSKSELRDSLATHGTAVAFVVKSLPARSRGITVAPILTPAVRAWYCADRARIAEFLVVLATGIPKHSPADTAALRLRDWCISLRDIRQRPTRIEQYRRAQNALRHFLDSNDPGRLRASEADLFPLPEGLPAAKPLAKLRRVEPATTEKESSK